MLLQSHAATKQQYYLLQDKNIQLERVCRYQQGRVDELETERKFLQRKCDSLTVEVAALKQTVVRLRFRTCVQSPKYSWSVQKLLERLDSD
jgi:hypothetical protein